MDSKDKELKQALDDIFGDNNSDTISLNNIEESSFESFDDSLGDNESSVLEDVALSDNDVIKEESITEENIEELYEDTVLLSKEELNKTNEPDDNYDLNDSSYEEKNTLSIKKIIIYFFVGIVLGFILIFCLINYSNDKELRASCVFVAEDNNYKVTDEYKITYMGNKITYVEGTYLYTAKTEEYKNQVEYIKEEKLPVIINSNGMSGFTYMYESSSESFKVYTYLDFEEFNINKISKINQDITPISFFEIKTDKKYDKLKEKLEKKGFKCTTSN